MLRKLFLFVFAVTLSLSAQNARFQKKIIPIDHGKMTNFLVKGDLNGDGVPDLVSINTVGSSHTMYTLLSNGSASYSPSPVPYAVSFPNPPMIADVNHDGHSDLIGTDFSNIFVYINDGTGHFGAPLMQPIAGELMDIADFNKDGNPDIVIKTYDQSTFHTTFTVYFGNGNGTFGPTNSSVTNVGFNNARAGDFDGDGNMDLLVTSNSDAGQSDFSLNLTLYYGDGAGHFSDPMDSYSFLDGGVAALADFDKDGRTDILIEYSHNQTYPKPDEPWSAIVYGSASRTPTKTDFPRGTPDRAYNYSRYPAGDLDRDGDIDIAASNFIAYAIQSRDASGNYGAPSVFYTASNQGQSAIVDDFTKDGNADVLVPVFVDSSVQLTQLELYINVASGSSCTAPATSGVDICEPLPSDSVDSPTHLRAAAKLSAAVYRFDVWESGTKLFTARDSASIDTNLNLAPGDHTLTLVAQTASGSKSQKSVSFTVSANAQSCEAPTTNGIVVCEPQPFQDVTSPFRVHAFARTGSTPTYRFELWWTSTKLATIRDSDTMDVQVSLAPGTKLLHFVARRADGTRFTKDMYVNVH